MSHRARLLTILPRAWVPFVFALAFLIVYHARASVGPTAPALRHSSGEQYVVVLVSASQCSLSEARELRRHWEKLNDYVGSRAEASGATVYTIGASLDSDVRAGMAALAEVAPFDEVAVGGGWLNTTVLRYVIRDFASHPSVPQMLVLSRKVTVGAWPDATSDSLLMRFYRPSDASRWVDRAKLTKSEGG